MVDTDPFKRFGDALAARYKVLGQLGEGGMAVVLQAEDLRHNRKVAIKVLKPELATEIGADRFLREIRLTAQLSHPHILPLLDSGEESGMLFYVTPLITGQSLRNQLDRERQLPLDTALRLVGEVADALAHAHANGVLHRDIKPENILISDGHALVADFGIARAVANTTGGLTATGLAVGTPAYMSPEQATADASVDARTDLYSLACVTYEMLVGEPPFTGPSPQAILSRRLTESPRRMRATRDAIPPAVDAVVMRALARVPADRHESVSDFAAELRKANALVTAPRRRPAVMLAAILTMVIIVSLGVVALLRNRGPALAPTTYRLAVLPLENLGDPSDAPFTDGMSDEIMSRLSEISAIRVVSRTSARRFRGTDRSVREVGASLNADYVLEGTVRTDRSASGRSTVRVTPRLIRVADDAPVWQRQFDAALVPGEILRVQGDIALQVAAALDVNLQAGERQRLRRVTTRDSAAYHLYQLGRFQWEKRDAASLQLAVQRFREAVGRDSTFADAYAGLSDALGALTLLYDATEPSAARQQAIDAARKAIGLDDRLAQAHASLGFLLFFFDWDWDAAEKSFRQAIALDPGYGPARYWYTQLLWMRGRYEDALVQAQAAVESDPLSGVSYLARGRTYRLLGRENEWLADLRRVNELQGSIYVVWWDLAEHSASKGSLDSARAMTRRFLDLRLGAGQATDRAVSSVVNIMAGRSGAVPAVEWNGLQARLFALSGQRDSALNRLSRMVSTRDADLVMMYPFLGPLLNADPRWRDLRAQLRLNE